MKAGACAPSRVLLMSNGGSDISPTRTKVPKTAELRRNGILAKSLLPLLIQVPGREFEHQFGGRLENRKCGQLKNAPSHGAFSFYVPAGVSVPGETAGGGASGSSIRSGREDCSIGDVGRAVDSKNSGAKSGSINCISCACRAPPGISSQKGYRYGHSEQVGRQAFV